MTVSDAEQRRRDALAGPCPYCGVPRGEHELSSLMVHVMMWGGMTEDEAKQVCRRIAARLSAAI